MDYLLPAFILALILIPTLLIMAHTRPSEKRGCGRGCARCGNREFCHRKKL